MMGLDPSVRNMNVGVPVHAAAETQVESPPQKDKIHNGPRSSVRVQRSNDGTGCNH
jgi:hypothetical protein